MVGPHTNTSFDFCPFAVAYYVPPQSKGVGCGVGRGGILFLVRILSASASGSFLSVLYLLNQLVDFHQTGTDTLLGRRKEVFSFSDNDLIFKVIPAQ